MRIAKYIFCIIVVGIAAYMMYPTQPQCTPLNREIAITIDDLPTGKADSEKIILALKKHQVPAFGFVIAGWLKGDGADNLKVFMDAGYPIGNHSYSHMRLRKVDVQLYLADLEKADKILAPMMQGTKYYRYPYLSQSSGSREQKVYEYLAANHYVIAPITIDSRDFVFNLELAKQKNPSADWMSKFKQKYLDFVWNATRKTEQHQQCSGAKQILLLHAQPLNAYFLDDLLSMFESHGYRFISFQEAMAGTPGVTQ